MALLSVQDLAFIFGLLGNIISFLVFLAPVPTFHKICKRKSSEGFHSIPYVVALFSASLLLFYAFLKKNAYMIVSINGFGCVIEVAYLFIYLLYAPKKEKVFTIRLILLDVGAIALVMLSSFLVGNNSKRVTLVGWVCAAVNLAVFASPLSIMRQVIKTKSVEFMPFTLSFFLTLCAATWFFYGFFISDYYIALPNVVGFLLGIAQMALYFMYKNAKKEVDENLEGAKEAKEDVEMNLKLDEEATNMKLSTEEKPNSDFGKQENQEMVKVKIEV